MAFIEQTGNDEVPFIYNVTMAVGPGTPNKKTDVELVQYLLHRIYEFGHRMAPPLVSPERSLIKIDGRAGLETFRWIVRFQRDLKRRGNVIATDGRVDRGRLSQGYVGSISQTRYSIFFMNLALRKVAPELWADITHDADLPTGVLSELIREVVIDVAGPTIVSAP